MFNVFDTQTVLVHDSTFNAGGAISSTYDRPSAWAAPRSIKLTAEYHHKF